MSVFRFVTLLFMTLGTTGCVEIEQKPEPASLDWAAFAAPTSRHRPWVRWWWPGGDVEDGELAREIEALADAGFGGAEIQAFAAALDPEASEAELARRQSWGDEGFYSHLGAALDAAYMAGLEISLTTGSGWPVGGDHLGPEESLKTLLLSEHPVTGPGTATITLDGPDLAPFYQIAESAEAMGEPLARYLGDQGTLVSVLAAKKIDGVRDGNPLVLTDQVRLDPATLVNLTDAVEGGVLVWEVPSGQWIVVAFWAAPDGEYVSLHAYPGEAWVVDHLDGLRVAATLDALLGPALGHTSLSGFFTDSFELKAERLWTADFLAEFASRRGYDPEPWLPVVMVPGADNHIFDGAGIPRLAPFAYGADDDRVRSDWQRTVSDLFIERYVETCVAWGEARGLRSRIQPYGVGIDVISAAAAAAVPEAEQLYAGGSEFFIKAVSSGGHLGGRAVVSAESMVWSGKDHMLTPTKLKAAADKLFTAGVNRILFHGFPYRVTEGYGAQGWHPFSSPWSGSGTYGSNVGESNAYWAFMPQINRYLARVQWVLQWGSRPDTDVAVYFPFVGVSAALGRLDDWDEELYRGAFPGEPGDDRNALFDLVDAILGPADPGPMVEWLRAVTPILEALDDAGVTWEWVNDAFLAGAVVGEDGRIVVGATDHAGILVAAAPWMEADAAEALAAVAAAGGSVGVYGDAPARVSGLDTGGLDARVAAAFAGIPSTEDPAAWARGLLGFSDFGVTGPVRRIRRHVKAICTEYDSCPSCLGRIDRPCTPGTGRAVFLRNPTAAAVVVTPGGSMCEAPLWVDPWAGTWEALPILEEGRAAPDRTIPPWGSRVLTCGLASPSPGAGWFDLTGQTFRDAVEVTTWELVVEGADVAGGAVVLDAGDLPDWRDVEALRYSSTPGVYTGLVSLPEAPAGYSVLRLGAVNGAATVVVNGADAGAALVPPFEVVVTGMLVQGDNVIEVTLIPPLRNRLVGHGISGDEEYRQYDKEETLVPVGLRGPVEILYF
ncbi:MAG: glycosyl hydrolase [Pseudomonadota bacterium]